MRVAFCLEQMQMAKFEAMTVKAELDTVRNEIRKCIRDGVVIKLTYSELHESITLDEYKEFETRFRSVWGITVSAIEATYLTPHMTELRLLPVMEIYHDQETYGVWKILRQYFKQLGLNDEKETLSTPIDFLSVADSATIEKRLREPTLPKLGDEQEFKNKRREFYETTKVHNRFQLDADSGRFLTADEIEIEVEQDWKDEQENIKALQARWNEIHSFEGMTLKEATKRYLMQNAQSEPPTTRTQAETSRSVNQQPGKPVDLSTRQKMLIGLLLLFAIAFVLFVLTLLVVLGVLPWQIALVVFVVGLAIERATNWLGAWNNVLSLVEKLFNRR
jgi:hypothetical protein